MTKEEIITNGSNQNNRDARNTNEGDQSMSNQVNTSSIHNNGLSPLHEIPDDKTNTATKDPSQNLRNGNGNKKAMKN